MRKLQSIGLLMLMVVFSFVVLLKASVGIMLLVYPDSELVRDPIYYARNWYLSQVFIFLWAIIWAHERRQSLGGEGK